MKAEKDKLVILVFNSKQIVMMGIRPKKILFDCPPVEKNFGLVGQFLFSFYTFKFSMNY